MEVVHSDIYKYIGGKSITIYSILFSTQLSLNLVVFFLEVPMDWTESSPNYRLNGVASGHHSTFVLL